MAPLCLTAPRHAAATHTSNNAAATCVETETIVVVVLVVGAVVICVAGVTAGMLCGWFAKCKLCKEGKVSKDAFYLIQKLLNINPKQRLTANLALKQGYFKINHSKGGKGARPDFDYFKVRRRDRGSCKGQWGLLVSNHPVVCVLVYVLLCMYDLMCFWWWLPRTVSHAHHRILILLTVTSFSSPYTPVFYPVRLPPVFYHVYHGSIRSCWRSWTRAGLITSLRRKRRRRRRGHGRSKS